MISTMKALYSATVLGVAIMIFDIRGTFVPLDSRDACIEQLFMIGAFQEGQFKLKSGISSPFYIDLRRIISHPPVYTYVVDLMWHQISDKKFNHLGGVPYAALPLASGMAVLYQRPMVMVRKEKKDHGTSRSVEGVFKKGDKVMIVEDIVTSGSSILETVELLEKEGLEVTDVVVFLDRQQGARELLTKKGITLHAVCTISDVLIILESSGKIDRETVRKVREHITEQQFS